MAPMTLQENPPSRRWGPGARTVVVGYDGLPAGRHVVAHAARRAGPGGYLIIVHALPPGVTTDSFEESGGYARLVALLLDTVAEAVPEGTEHETRVVTGSAARAILEAAERHGADEVVVGTADNRGALGGVGRVSNSLLKHADCPVTIVPRQRRPRKPPAGPGITARAA